MTAPKPQHDQKPQHDPTFLLDEFRTAQLSHLIVAAVCEFDIGRVLCAGPREFGLLCGELGLQQRPAIVLLTGLRSVGLIDIEADGRVALTEYGFEKLSPKSEFHLRGYIGLGALSGDVQNMIACLRNDAPAGDVSFVYHEGKPSALDDAETADLLTRAMSDRARNVAPFVAERLDLGQATNLVDVGGAHGLYAQALLQANANLRATIIDRDPPLRVAAEYAEKAGLQHRLALRSDDAHRAILSENTDVVLLANLLHDYDADVCQRMVSHYAGQLPEGGMLVVLDSLLESVAAGQPPISAGPRAVAAYSALLFTICEGRCYRRDEVESWMHKAGLVVDAEAISVPAHGSLVVGRRAL